MIWKKLGLIFVPNRKIKWMNSHAALPIPLLLHDDLFRIYFSSRKSSNIANIGFLEINLNDPKKILKISKKPVLQEGRTGCFDDCGVMAHSIVKNKNKIFLYYTGWNRSTTVPFRWSIGLAISNDGGKTFERYSEGPVMDRNTIDPVFVASPTVIFEKGKWRMWYSSGLGWKNSSHGLHCPYHIKYAESKNGIDWKRNGTICIDFLKKETRIGRPSIIKANSKYLMWFSVATNRYRIGYAESIDGIKWKRKDKLAQIDVSKTGWDSKMIEYPFVFNSNSKRYMLFNGNNFGQSGFGLAVASY